MTDGLLVPPHIVLSPFVVATRVIALRFLLWDLICSSVPRVIRPEMTVEVFQFCAAFVATFSSHGTLSGSFVVVLVLPVRNSMSAIKNRASEGDGKEGQADVSEQEE